MSVRPVAPYLDKQRWLDVRSPLIGSSDVGAILGVDPYTQAGEIWDRIVLDVRPEVDGADVRRGQKQEAIAVAAFEETYGLSTELLPMVRHSTHPFLVTDIDRLIQPPPQWPESLAALMDPQQGPGALEVKVPRIANFFRYREEGLPLPYILQHQHHFAVTGYTWGVFVFYTPEYDDLVAFPVLRDDEFINGVMVPQLVAWWKRHVVAKQRPTRPLPAPARWPTKVPGTARLRDDERWGTAAGELIDAVAELERARMRAESAEGQLVALLEETDQHVAGAGVTVKRKSTASQRRFDPKAFKAAVLLAQQEQDADALLSINPDDDAFYFMTASSEKVDVRLTGRTTETQEGVAA